MAALLGVMMPSIVSFGYNQSLLGGVLTLNNFEQQFREIDVDDATLSEKGQKSTVQGTIVALYAVGGLFGALSCIGLGDLLGRRRVILVAALTQMIGAILMASAFDFVHLIVARLILGLGCGGLLATVPIWQSEISSPHKRGAHVSTTGLFAGAGTSLSLFLDLGMSFAPGSVSWRFPFAFQVLFSIAIIGAISFMPESPRWLIQQNRTIKAREILAALEDVKSNDSKIDAEIQAIQLSLKLSGEGSLGQIFQMGPQRIFHRAMLAASVMLFLQLTGVNVITFFSMLPIFAVKWISSNSCLFV
jgi:MFS family permease